MRITVNTRKVRMELLDLLEVTEDDAPMPLINAILQFYFQQVMVEAKNRDLRFTQFESVDDPTAPDFTIADAAEHGGSVQILTEATAAAFDAARAYAAKRVLRGTGQGETEYKEL